MLGIGYLGFGLVMYHNIKLKFTLSFYVGLRASFKQVLDSIFEEGFLEEDAIDTYERMKNIFGHPMNDKVESTTLLCFYQNESIKEMKSSVEANFRNMLNLTSSINGNVLPQIEG